MKKQYTKKQITEAISYWKKMLNEDYSSYGKIAKVVHIPGYDAVIRIAGDKEDVEELLANYGLNGDVDVIDSVYGRIDDSDYNYQKILQDLQNDPDFTKEELPAAQDGILFAFNS